MFVNHGEISMVLSHMLGEISMCRRIYKDGNLSATQVLVAAIDSSLFVFINTLSTRSAYSLDLGHCLRFRLPTELLVRKDITRLIEYLSNLDHIAELPMGDLDMAKSLFVDQYEQLLFLYTTQSIRPTSDHYQYSHIYETQWPDEPAPARQIIADTLVHKIPKLVKEASISAQVAAVELSELLNDIQQKPLSLSMSLKTDAPHGMFFVKAEGEDGTTQFYNCSVKILTELAD